MPVYAHFHINYIIQEEGLRLRSALSFGEKVYFLPYKSTRTHSARLLSELQSLTPVGHDVAICINLLNPHVNQLDDLAHVAAWQAQAEASANSLIEVDVDTDTTPRNLTPTSLICMTRLAPTMVSTFEAAPCRRKERSLSCSLSPVRYMRHASVDMDLIMSDSSDEEDNLSDLDRPGPGTRDGASIDSPAPSFNDVCSTFSLLHRQQERRYELQERACILALDQAIAGQRSTVEVELLYVNHTHLPAEQCADTVSTAFEEEEAASLPLAEEQKHTGLLLDERGPVAPMFMDYCFSKKLGAAGETAPTCQRTSSAQNSSVGTSQVSPGPRSRLPVETRPRDADFPDGNQNCAPGHKPSQEPPGIVSRPSVETHRRQADFHYGYQNVSQDPKSPLHVGVCFSKCAHAMPSFLVAIRVEHKAK
ncbi:hypothetical protein B0H17DRAFT_1136117 [Mycena rosella]|uniref:Uncharacterized protein n=1 Tax=Mycena rosella TaxID=1033263 RepID=A0AAD7DBJ1_MYCRO|nr:hypothetical protein B0H17DRAFT_1136117 [Mycena rosella]